MFENILQKLDAMKQTVDANVPTVKDAIRDQIPFMELALLEALIDGFVDAMQQIPEYNNSQAAPLREHLIDNLQYMDGEHPVHIKLSEDGHPLILFDEVFAGGADDFHAGEHFSTKNHNNPELRFIFWKYGIYKPGVEGDSSETNIPWMAKAMDNLPSYGEIIEERLSRYGHTAPYWYFIEKGTAGGGKPYPSFAGTNVVRWFRREAKEAIREFLRGLVDELEEAVVQAISKSFEEGTPKPPLAEEVLRNKILTRSGNVIWKNAKGQFTRKPRSR